LGRDTGKEERGKGEEGEGTLLFFPSSQATGETNTDLSFSRIGGCSSEERRGKEEGPDSTLLFLPVIVAGAEKDKRY